MKRVLQLGLVTLAPLLAACGDGPAGPAASLPSLEVGGSNYVMYSVGDYTVRRSQESWFRRENLRPVIGTYHLDSLQVKRQLAVMHENGQRRLALVLWHSDFNADPAFAGRGVHGHVVNSAAGALTDRHAANLRSLLRAIVNAGYQEVVFRFATQWSSDPRGWVQWREALYQRNWSFIRSTVELVEETMAGTGVPVLYDLDLELGGLAGEGKGQIHAYTTRLWHDYLELWTPGRTVGFSLSARSGRLTKLIRAYDEVGVRPGTYAFDLYGNERASLNFLFQELAAAGEAEKPVILQEVYYNDPQTASEIDQARRDWPINLRYLLQWPIRRSTKQPHFSVHFPAAFDAYSP